MRTLSIALVAAALALAALPADAARKALVIGNAAYKTQPLANPVNDATDMAGRLKELGFSVTQATNTTQREMAVVVSEFRRNLTPGDEVIVFYAGHGMQVRGQNWLIPVDADPRDEAEVEVIAVSLDWLLRSIVESGARTTLMLLDACRDNPFARTFRSGGRGLARLETAASGTLVSYAAKPGTVAADGAGRNSPYTAAWLAALAEPSLTHHHILDRVHEAVRRATGDRQETWEEGRLVGTLVLNEAPVAPAAGGVQPPAPDPRPVDPAAVELRFWESVERGGTRADYESYLAQYPEGRFAALAQARLDGMNAADRDRLRGMVRDQIEPCWSPPTTGTSDPVLIHLTVDRNGRVRKARIVDEARARRDFRYRMTADAATLAVKDFRCTPLRLPPEQYELWKEIELTFAAPVGTGNIQQPQRSQDPQRPADRFNDILQDFLRRAR